MKKLILTVAVLSLLGVFSKVQAAYDSNVGRWISRDPLPDAETSQGPNAYWYVWNDPANSIDPRGTDVWVESTNAIFGFHQRMCVDVWDDCCTKKIGKYCQTFGNGTPTGSCASTKAWGTGVVAEDNSPDSPGYHSTGEVVRYTTSCKEDKKILEVMKKLNGSTGPYAVGLNTCRDWSQQTAKQLGQWPKGP